jgi:hypothetical protein
MPKENVRVLNRRIKSGVLPMVEFTSPPFCIEAIAPLTKREQRYLQIAEQKISTGLKSFVEVGLALLDIKTRRLYREHFATFEEYCIQRWELSRPRAYELCAASEAVVHLSANADILPDNEAQVRPLTRLKDPVLRQKAWALAQNTANRDGRKVTARDTEDAVRVLNGFTPLTVPTSEPVLTCCQGTNADLIASVARLYLKQGARIADLTYGRGVFWQKVDLSSYNFCKSDKLTCPSTPYDFGNLPYDSESFDVVVFDPPYAHHAGNMRVESCYQNATTTYQHNHRDIIEGYRRGMKEAVRILKPSGTLWTKCQDEIEAGKQRRSSIEIFQIAQELGLLDQDLFVLMQETSPAIRHRDQHHARKNHSYLWVFRKFARNERRR